jgi:predicted Rossmann fold flavoprotein
MTTAVDVIVIGAGAAGLMCAIEAAKRGRRVLVLDHANKPGKKILMSGGGRCNFTNMDIDADNFLSRNPHFCKSALSRYTQWDFIALVEKHGIPFHEREHGQLFCNDSSKDILAMLLDEAANANVKVQLETTIGDVRNYESDATATGFELLSNRGAYRCDALVVASGGLSIPRMGATPFGYQLAARFAIKIQPTRAGLVPFTLHADDHIQRAALSGVAIECRASNARQSYERSMLFTHRGLSGPAMLQLSSYWEPGESFSLDLCPQTDLTSVLESLREQSPRMQLNTALHEWLPRRVISSLLSELPLEDALRSLSSRRIEDIARTLHNWQVKPAGTEGYRTAEVTLGGVDCDALSSKTMQSKQVPGLYFIGEVVDVTGWLGGYNFQWAWSSGWCAGQYV